MVSWLRTISAPGSVFLILLGIQTVVPLSGQDLSLRLDKSTVAFGVYDPSGNLSHERGIKIEHIFLDWNGRVGQEISGAASRAKGLGRRLLVTVEPWARPNHSDKQAYFQAIVSGEYDDSILKVCNGLSQLGNSVLVRWGHEMDTASGRYPWGNLDPQQFIRIYRYFVGKCRVRAPFARFVWSPRGDAGSERYYPGADFVDLVGLTLFGLEPWEMANYGHARSFEEALMEKYQPIQRFGKRLILAEFGVCGEPSFRQAWISSALEHGSEQFPLLEAVIYFNDREPYLWPNKLDRHSAECESDTPDWRIR